MSIQVKQFDEIKAGEALKTCPKIVKDYVKLLKGHNENYRKSMQEMVSRIRLEAKQGSDLEKLMREVIDVTWAYAFDDESVPSTLDQNRIIQIVTGNQTKEGQKG